MLCLADKCLYLITYSCMHTRTHTHSLARLIKRLLTHTHTHTNYHIEYRHYLQHSLIAFFLFYFGLFSAASLQLYNTNANRLWIEKIASYLAQQAASLAPPIQVALPTAHRPQSPAINRCESSSSSNNNNMPLWQPQHRQQVPRYFNMQPRLLCPVRQQRPLSLTRIYFLWASTLLSSHKR